ncbi:MAG: hypothetical protein EBY29_13695, partial [Planctomycetes bacterium]|nr:hypothetical protein [Planctomycetota bacterium]
MVIERQWLPLEISSVTEASFLRHEPCPACGSKNNLARYSDGHGFCFGCKHH